MYTSLRFFRYLVFGFFLVCNAIIATVAVWNLNLIQDALLPSSSLPLRTDAFLIFVGCAGLALILPILLCEVAYTGVFLVQVWFECIWVALFSIMELAGAASASAAGADELCGPLVWIGVPANRSAICVSSRVLQAFSWICGLYLLFYFVVLFVTTLLKSKEDRTIWQCYAGRFPWMSAHHKLANTPTSQLESCNRPVSKRLSRTPIIAAPRPRNAVNEAVRRAILSYRSGLSMDYTIEHFRPPNSPQEATKVQDRPLPPPPATLPPEQPKLPREAPVVSFSHSLYPQHVQTVLPLSSGRQLQASQQPPQQPPSPSPIGDWPRLNPPTPRPKRKSQKAGSLAAALPETDLRPNLPPHSQVAWSSPSMGLPTFDFETPVAAPLVPPPPTSYSTSRTRPSGPRLSLERHSGIHGSAR